MTPLTSQEAEVLLGALRRAGIAPYPLCQDAVARVVLHDWTNRSCTRGPKTLVAAVALRDFATAITLGRHIYVRRCDLPCQEIPLTLLAHEVAHTVQFRRDGWAPFLLRYVGEYLLGRAKGQNHYEAYRSISYEREAREVEEVARRHAH